MTVLDLGGTVDFWQDGTIKPARVVLLNTYESSSGLDPTLEVVQGDACMLPAALAGQRFDVVLSNSTIEHVGGHERRQAFAATVHNAADAHWIQTPYRYFPFEPHWLFPGFQFLPIPAQAWIDKHWPLTHTKSPDWSTAVEAALSTQLLGKVEFTHYFPDSQLVWERVGGLPKSMIALRTENSSGSIEH